MTVLASMDRYGHQQTAHWRDPRSGLRAIIAIHSTVLGPALGGCRMYPYEREEDALEDVLRLSRGMTYKAAVAGLALGGGKSVIIGDPATDKSDALLRSFGEFVDTLHGRYLASLDVGTTVTDLDVMRTVTPHIAGVEPRDSGEVTYDQRSINDLVALGVFEGLRAAVARAYGSPELDGRTVAVQGLGHVGLPLCELLHGAGARLIVSDIRTDAVRDAMARFGAVAVEPGAILEAECDVLAPCALGGVLDATSVPELRCRVVAGAANNVLRDPEDGRRLHDRGILLAPDYVINSGGIIAEVCGLEGLDFSVARERVLAVYGNLERVLELADMDGIAPSDAADRYAEERLALAGTRRG